MKLLATDYDGTLKFGQSVLEEDIQAIRDWREQGNLFAIVTGRSKESITKEMEEFNIPADFYVTNNGGMVFDANGEVLMSTQLDTVTAIDLMFASHEMPEVVSYMVNDGIHRHKVDVHPYLEDHRYPNVSQDMEEQDVMDSGSFAQLVYSCSTPEAALELAEKINDYFGNSVTAYANNFVVDIVPLHISKASGLEFLQAYCDIDDEDIYPIGDSHNDIPMLEAYSNSAAVALADEEVRQSAHGEAVSVKEYVDSIVL
jgi:Cof subfamily protein (haloacid dehalogenase superfamily)